MLVGIRKRGTPAHCWWECKLEQPLREMMGGPLESQKWNHHVIQQFYCCIYMYAKERKSSLTFALLPFLQHSGLVPHGLISDDFLMLGVFVRADFSTCNILFTNSYSTSELPLIERDLKEVALVSLPPLQMLGASQGSTFQCPVCTLLFTLVTVPMFTFKGKELHHSMSYTHTQTHTHFINI